MEPNFYHNQPELQCQIYNPSSLVQQSFFGGMQQDNWNGIGYGGYQEPSQWGYNCYSTPHYSEWNQPWGGSYDDPYGGHYQVQPPPPSPYYQEEPPYECWHQEPIPQEHISKSLVETYREFMQATESFLQRTDQSCEFVEESTQQFQPFINQSPQENMPTQEWPLELPQIFLQQGGSTKTIRELLLEQGYDYRLKRERYEEFPREPCQAVQHEQDQICGLENRMEETNDVVSQVEAQKFEEQQFYTMMVSDEDEDEVVNTPSVGVVEETPGDMIPCGVEDVKKQERVPNNDPTPPPLLVEESTPQPDGTIYLGVIDPFEQYMEDISAKNGVLLAIREQLGLEELIGHQDGVELMTKPRKPLFGQMHELVTSHGWLNLERVGVG